MDKTYFTSVSELLHSVDDLLDQVATQQIKQASKIKKEHKSLSKKLTKLTNKADSLRSRQEGLKDAPARRDVEFKAKRLSEKEVRLPDLISGCEHHLQDLDIRSESIQQFLYDINRLQAHLEAFISLPAKPVKNTKEAQ